MKFELTPEEKELLRQANEARDRDDWESFRKLAKQIPLEPSWAMAIKKVKGADYLINKGYNLTWANRKYGNDWLNR